MIRHRNHVLFLDSTQLLTHGNPVGFSALIDNVVSSVDQIVVVAPASSTNPDRIGRLHFVNGERSAHLSFIFPRDQIDSSETLQLLDGLAAQAGQCGCLCILADLEEDSAAFETFRKCGYSVYTHQHVFKNVGEEPSGQEDDTCWQSISPRSGASVRNLYQALVPPIVQGMEPLTAGALPGWMGIQDGEVTAYAVHKTGPVGDFIQPIIHPGVRDAGQLLNSLFAKIRTNSRRPLYLAVRSYQSWLEKYLPEDRWQISSREVLMVKHLSVYERMPVTVERRPVMETNPSTEPTAPMAGYKTQSRL